MFLVVSVVELTFGVPTFPESTHCTTRVTTHASRSAPEDKFEDDPETMFLLMMASALWDAVVFSGSLLESSLVEKKGITSAVLASPLVVVLCGTETNRRCATRSMNSFTATVGCLAHFELTVFDFLIH